MAETKSGVEEGLAFDALDSQMQQLVEQVQASGSPLVITKDGRSAVILVEAHEYEQQQRRLMLMDRIARGKQDIANGRVHSQEEVEALLDEWLCGE